MVRPLIRAEGISRSYGPTHVLHQATFQVNPGEKIALVGPNGAGKTTLFKLLAGQLQPDLGEIERQDGLRIAYLPQVPEAPATTLVSEILAAPTPRAEQLEAEAKTLETWMGEPGAFDAPDAQTRMDRYAEVQTELAAERAKGTLTWSPLMDTLGLEPPILEKNWGKLSGGERSKVVLCKVLAQAKETDLLLLDEPTNHMDIPTVEFIEDYLIHLDGAVVVAAHDRYLLDNVADRVFELTQQKVWTYTGNFSSYLAQKEAIARALQARKRRELDEYKRQLQIIEELKRRNKYDSQVKSRRTRLTRAFGDGPDGTANPTTKKGFKLLFETNRVPRRVLTMEHVTKRFGERTLFQDVNLELAGGEKLGLIGPNGSGKSTLLKLITGELQPDEGTVTLGQTVDAGTFHQHHENLHHDRTLLEEIRSLRDPPPPDDWTRGLLGRFRFSGDTVHKQVGQLSGGERARLALAKFVAEQHNLLLLDEPTNHLDLEGQEIVADALSDYEGSVIVISHDRSFLDMISDRIAVIHDEKVGVFRGNFSQARTSKEMAAFTNAGIRARYRVLSAFRDNTRDQRYQKGDTIEATGLETQDMTRLIRRAMAEGLLERIE